MATTTNVIRNGITINEIFYNPTGGNFDTTNNGQVREIEDEFIEIYNTSSSSIDISGLEIYDDFENFFTFPSGTILGAGNFAVVVRNATLNNGSLPTVSQGNLAFDAANTRRGNAFLTTRGDMIAVYDPDTNNYIQVNYGSPFASSPAVPDGATLLGSVEDWGSSDGRGVSIARSPDGDTQISLQNTFGFQANATPGESNGLTADTTGPVIDSTTPSADQLVITFNEVVSIGTTGNFVITNPDGTQLTFAFNDPLVTFNGDDTVTINPAGDLVAGNYTVAIDPGAVVDGSANTNPNLADTASFTVADTDGPVIDSTTPSADQLVITFDEDVSIGTTGNFVITNPDGTQLTFAFNDPLVSFNGDDTVTINPAGDLVAGNYTVAIDPGAVVDGSANTNPNLADTASFTVADTDTDGPVIDSTTPSADQLVITFNEVVSIGTTGNFVITNPDGTQLTFAFNDPLVSFNGDDTVTINPAGDLVAGNYTVAIDPGAVVDGSTNANPNIAGTASFTVAPAITPLPNLQVDDNDLFIIDGDSSSEVNLKATLTSTDAAFSNEVGVFTVQDDDGTISVNGITLTPDDGDAYVQAALEQSKVLFSNLGDKPNGFDGSEQSRTVSGFNGGDNLRFFLVSNGTADQVLNGEISEDQVIFGATSDSDAFNPLRVTDLGNSEFSLSWEDQVGGGDESFDDLVLDIKLTDDQPPLGSNLQGGNYAEVIDLRDFDSVELEFSIFREAAFDNEVYFYEVDSVDGFIDSLAPNTADYMQAALDNVVLDENGNALKFALDDDGMGTGSATISGGSIVAPMIIIDGSLEELQDMDTSNDPTVYFPYMGANSDSADHVKLLGDNTFGFEDLANGGDKDFNDMIVRFDNLTANSMGG